MLTKSTNASQEALKLALLDINPEPYHLMLLEVEQKRASKKLNGKTKNEASSNQAEDKCSKVVWGLIAHTVHAAHCFFALCAQKAKQCFFLKSKNTTEGYPKI